MELKKLLESRKYTSDSKQKTVASFQDYALDICKCYNIKGPYKNAIFRLAKTRKSWLEGKVGLMRELEQNNPTTYKELKEKDKLANYLFSLFRKK